MNEGDADSGPKSRGHSCHHLEALGYLPLTPLCDPTQGIAISTSALECIHFLMLFLTFSVLNSNLFACSFADVETQQQGKTSIHFR